MRFALQDINQAPFSIFLLRQKHPLYLILFSPRSTTSSNINPPAPENSIKPSQPPPAHPSSLTHHKPLFHPHHTTTHSQNHLIHPTHLPLHQHHHIYRSPPRNHFLVPIKPKKPTGLPTLFNMIITRTPAKPQQRIFQERTRMIPRCTNVVTNTPETLEHLPPRYPPPHLNHRRLVHAESGPRYHTSLRNGRGAELRGDL